MLDLRLVFNCAKRDFALRLEEGSEDGIKLCTEMPKSAAMVSAKFMGVEISFKTDGESFWSSSGPEFNSCVDIFASDCDDFRLAKLLKS